MHHCPDGTSLDIAITVLCNSQHPYGSKDTRRKKEKKNPENTSEFL